MQIKVELQEWMGSDKAIAEAAWTSSLDYQKKQLRTDDDVKRIVNMLADLKHSVPFESIIFKFWIKMPIQTDRQHMSHRIASHSGMSGRYRTMPSEWLHVPEDIKNLVERYGSISFLSEYENLCKQANEWYKEFLSDAKYWEQEGIINNPEYKRLREFFRGILPQNNMTERVTMINLRSFSNYYKLRSKNDAQPEIQIIANQMFEQIKQKNICPIALDALERNNWSILC